MLVLFAGRIPPLYIMAVSRRGFFMTIQTPEWSIDDLPTLSLSLGKSGSDRIRFHLYKDKPSENARERFIDNPHRQLLLDTPLWCGGPIDDILSGIANLGVGTEKSFSSLRLHVILQSADRISSGLLEKCLNVNQRQARRYMAAVKLAIYHITRHTNKV